MNKKTKFKLNETLDKALAPPKRKDKSVLDGLLSQYDMPEHPKSALLEITSTSYTSIPSSTSYTSRAKGEISPVRDFQKIPNSITKNLDLFRGKSKQVWDYLWSVSRGAINPSRTVRKSRVEIKSGAKVGSMVTVDAAIEHLTANGLLKVVRSIGSLRGNEYEIFTPEETGTSTSSTSISSTTSPTQKVDELDIPESSNTSITQTAANKDTSGASKTSLKTNTNDDEAFADFLTNFSKLSHEFTGKGLSRTDREKWEKLSDLLILEFRIAARRTGSISSIPAFLTEVLRRKFRDVASSVAKTPKVKPDTVGKAKAETYEIKPLDEADREAALEQLREFAGDEFLEDFKKWYTEEDWTWLMDKLGVSQNVKRSI